MRERQPGRRALGGRALNGEHHEHEHHGHEHSPANEEELRARLEEELKRITVRDVLVQTVVTLINLGGQRLGLSETSKEASDPEQTRVAIEAVRSLLPLLEAEEGGPEQIAPVRDALAQLQMAYARLAGAPEGQPQAAPGRRRPSRRTNRHPSRGALAACGSRRAPSPEPFAGASPRQFPCKPRSSAASRRTTAIDCRGF